MGNLIGLLTLNHFRLAGYKPIVVFGGATGLIGDPSGRQTERKQMLSDQVQHNIAKFETLFRYLTDNLNTHLETTINQTHGETGFGSVENQGGSVDWIKSNMREEFKFVNNYDFYKDLNIISFLRDVGVHFRLGTMLSRDSVKNRIGGNSA